MAKEQTDTTRPAWAKPNTMATLRQAGGSAKPPVAKSKTTGGPPINRRK
jgi:hypothetical protein